MNGNSIAKWLMQHQRGDTLVLRQVMRRGVYGEAEEVAPVREWTRAGDPAELGQEVIAAAAEDSEDTGGVTRYRIVLLAGEEVVARKEWEMFGEKITEQSGVAEPATPAGLVAQAQRHVEAIMKLAGMREEQHHRAQMQVMGVLESTLARSEARAERFETRMLALEQGRIEQVQITEALLSERAVRELAAKKAESDFAYRKAIFERFEPGIPLVVNKLLGKPLAKEDDGAFDVLEAFVTSLKKPQIDAFMQSADPVQMTNFVKLWDRIEERVKERDKKKADAAKAEAEKAEQPAAPTNGAAS